MNESPATKPISELPDVHCHQLINDQLPAKLQELSASASNLNQIAEYCRTMYAVPDLPPHQYEEYFNQAKTYALQGLSAVAFQFDQYAQLFHDAFSMEMTLLEEDGNNSSMISQVSTLLENADTVLAARFCQAGMIMSGKVPLAFLTRPLSTTSMKDRSLLVLKT